MIYPGNHIIECIRSFTHIFLGMIYSAFCLLICIDEIRREKIAVIHKYLEDEFPDCKICVGYDFNQMAPKFQLFGGNITYRMIIHRGFFSNRTLQDVKAWLRSSKLSQALMNRANSTATIRSDGQLADRTESDCPNDHRHTESEQRFSYCTGGIKNDAPKNRH